MTSGKVGINISVDAREELRSLSYALTGKAGRRVTMSEALTAACKRAQQDIAATAGLLSGEEIGE